MIKPTIFIGLGTTGTNILKTLRQLMSEEYSHAGLPVFRYVAIETTEYETGDNLPQFEKYERIAIVNAIIESLAPIQSRLDPYHQYYNPHLADWLNPAFLNQIHSFKDGVGNIRMAGRLCLWENWEQIRRTLASAYAYVIEGRNKRETSRILTEHYEAKNLDVPIQLVSDDGINVYVVGTLCGGTCGGMLIDIAYLHRNILGGNAHNKIYGIFTMFDRISAGSNEEDITVHSANCYAILSELNFYNHPNTIYDATFPNGLRVNTPQKPYDYNLLVSPTSKHPAIRFVTGGEVDENGLNFMVALNLFAEAVSDTDGQRGAIPIDGMGFGGLGTLKPVPAGEIRTMVPCLASFGLTAVWYPKYRIASAAACFASRKLCTSWKGKHTHDEEIKANASNEWHHIIENVDILTSPQVKGQPSLKDEIRYLLENARKVFNQIDSSEELMQEMNAFPGEEVGPFRSRFDEGGWYFEWMNAKLDECKEACLSAIDQLLDNQLTRVDFHDTYGLEDVRVFFVELDHIIEQTIQQCPSELPTLDLNALDFEPMRNAENNIWLKITGRQKRAVETHREKLIEDYRQLIIGYQGIYPKMRNYFLRTVLEEVRAKLGFGVHSDRLTIKQQLDQIAVNLEHCEQELQEEYEYVIRPPRYECVKIVTNNPQNSIQTDAESLSNQIINNITSAELLVENGNLIKMNAFLKKDHEDLMLQIIETYRRLTLNKINEVSEDGIANGSVVTKVQEILNTDGDDIRNLARRSNPYIEFTPMYQPFALVPGTKIVFGHDPIGQSLDALRDSLGFERIGHSSIDHLLFFYEEEAGFAFDDLEVYEPFKNHFERNLSPYGHWTHQNPNFYDLTFQHKKHELQRWCVVLARLIPHIWDNINPDVFGDVFRREKDKCVFEYSIDGIMATLELLDDLNGIERLSREENNTAYNHFFQSVRDGFAQIDREKITHLINELFTSVGDLRAHHELAERFTGFLYEIYPTDGN